MMPKSFSDSPHDRYAPIPIAGAVQRKEHDRQAMRIRREEDIPKEKTNTQFNVVPLIK